MDGLCVGKQARGVRQCAQHLGQFAIFHLARHARGRILRRSNVGTFLPTRADCASFCRLAEEAAVNWGHLLGCEPKQCSVLTQPSVIEQFKLDVPSPRKTPYLRKFAFFVPAICGAS